jgi:hypothetical protein
MKISVLFFSAFLISFTASSQIQIGNDIDGEGIGDYSGHSVSLSSDGNILAVGAYSNEADSGGTGHVRVYEKQLGVWAQLGNDIEGKPFSTLFGYTVSLSSDGSTVAVGAISNFGYVRIFRLESGIWEQMGEDIDGIEASGRLGYSVSLSSDGTIVAIGSPGRPNGSGSGYTSIYKLESDTWSQIGDDIENEASGDYSGYSVSMSSDGSIVAIGAPRNNGEGSLIDIGQVRVFENQSDVWTQLGNDIDGESIGYESGFSVSLSSDGTIVAIGAPDNGGNGIQSGHVRVYKYESGVWLQVGDDIDGEVAYYKTGWSVSLSSNGDNVAIGEIGSISGATDIGRVRIFKNISGVWTQIGDNIFGEASEDYSGWSVSLSSDASVLAVGAPYNDGNGEDSGNTRVYDLSDRLSLNNQEISKISLFPNPSKQQFTIQLQDGLQLKKVTIYDSLGKLVKVVNANVINTLELSSGIYFIEIITNKGKATKKLVVD